MNNLKIIFQGMSGWVQLLFFCLIVFVGMIVASLATFVLALVYMLGDGESLSQSTILTAMLSTDFVRIAQFLQQVFMMLIPALLCIYLFEKNGVKSSLGINKLPDLKFVSLSALLILVVQPIISFTGYYNAQIKLPEFMSGIEAKLQELELTNKLLIERLLMETSLSALVANLFIIAVMAAIVEEFLFRGALQRIINKITSNYHIAVWVTAIIFSAIHMQFYGFVPRVILGAILGYMFVWSGNLWVPIIVHAINNALSVVLYRMYYNTPTYNELEQVGIGGMWWITLLSLVVTFSILICMQRMYIKQKTITEYY